MLVSCIKQRNTLCPETTFQAKENVNEVRVVCNIVWTSAGHRNGCFWWASFQQSLFLCFSASRMEKICGFSDPQEKRKSPLRGQSKNSWRHLTAPTLTAAIVHSYRSDTFLWWMPLCPGPGRWGGKMGGLSFRTLGPANKLEKQRQIWWQDFFPTQNCTVWLTKAKAPGLSAGSRERELAFTCEGKQEHTVKQVKEIRCAQRAMCVFPTLLRDAFDVRQMPLLEQDRLYL